MHIGVSKLAPNYGGWLKKLNESVTLVDFYGMSVEEAIRQLSLVSGLLLTGGGDIHPEIYRRKDDLLLCHGVDENRDELETALIKAAMELKLPVLGICRGQQMLNVAKGGTLYADIPAMVKTEISHSGPEDQHHQVVIQEDSLLCGFSGLTSGIVNSAHHQAVLRIARDFRVSAYSPDGIIEAMELKKSADHPFCVAVQWHPERMELENPLSGLVGKAFMEAAMK